MNANTRRVRVAARTALSITRRFRRLLYPFVRATKKVVAPIGFTIAKIATNVPTVNVNRSAAMAAAEGWSSQELVERLPRRRDVPGVAQGRERRLRPRLLHLYLPLDDLHG